MTFQNRIPHAVYRILILMLLVLITTSCATGQSSSPASSSSPATAVAVAPTPEPTPTTQPTPTLTPTATPEPTATPMPTATPTPIVVESAVEVVAQPEPEVTIPQGWSVLSDERLGYTFAVPASWLVFDLHSDNIDSVAGLLGGAGAMDQIEGFLNSPAGEGVGLVAVEPDVTQLFATNPFPMVANVSVAFLPSDFDQNMAVDLVTRSIEGLGDADLLTLEQGLVNNLPGIQATGRVNLAEQGMDVQLHVGVTTIFREDRAYILTLAAKEGNQDAKAGLFSQIPGTLAPID